MGQMDTNNTLTMEMQHPPPHNRGDGEDLASEKTDDGALVRLGKKPVLKRNFGFMSILGFSCTVTITWESFLYVFEPSLLNGGQAGVIYGYLFVWLGSLSVFAVLSEAVSMAPTSGGQYHWVAMLSPTSCQKILSYITGWFTVLGWQAFLAAAGFLAGTMLQGLIVLTNPNYAPAPWQAVLLYWASIIFAVLINTILSSQLPKLEGLILVLHVLGFFAILLPLVILGPHDNATNVFETFVNGGNWPTDGLSFFVGLLGNVFAFFGADGAIHLSEEIQNAPVVVPRAILLSIIVNGALGFGIAIAVLFCMGDIESALESPTGYPFMQIFLTAVQSTAGAAVMVSLILFFALCANICIVASASRQLWAFSRDRAVPFWSHLQLVNSKTAVPIMAVTVSTVISCLLALIVLGSSTAFNDLVSFSVVGLFSSYFMVAGLLLWRRIRGDIKPYASLPSDVLTNVPGAELTWGPWRIPGVLGIINNAFAVAYLLIIYFFSFWPPSSTPTASTMNYSSVMLGSGMAFSLVYYYVRARKVYKGPVIEI